MATAPKKQPRDGHDDAAPARTEMRVENTLIEIRAEAEAIEKLVDQGRRGRLAPDCFDAAILKARRIVELTQS